MPGNRKKTNKLYISMKEWEEDFGGMKKQARKAYQPLPFDADGLVYQPFKDPYATPDGYVFDISNIIPWIQKHGVCPMTGKPLAIKDLIKLHFHKNQKGEYHCPMTFKVFTEFTHIVFIKTSGNVYAMEAIEELCIKRKRFNDLLTGEPFTRSDIISIQDPQNPEARNMANFYYLQKGLNVEENVVKMAPNQTAEKILKELEVVEKEREQSKAQKKEEEDKKKQEQQQKILQDPLNQVLIAHGYGHMVNGQNLITPHYESCNFTSQGFVAKKIDLSLDDVPKSVKKKGYVRLCTNKGNLNIELHCDLCPKTTENFIMLCEAGYYNGVKFHRSIRDFMIQGGDPTGRGKGGQSAWGKPFKDEIKQQLTHSARGIISMANSGPNTNGSQFFILYKSAPHLDGKHAVFGRVVGGLETIDAMEEIDTDEHDCPLQDIVIVSTNVFQNPFIEAKETEDDKKTKEKEKEENQKKGQWFSNPTPSLPKPVRSGIGKYLPSGLLPNPEIPSTKKEPDFLAEKPSNKRQQPDTPSPSSQGTETEDSRRRLKGEWRAKGWKHEGSAEEKKF